MKKIPQGTISIKGRKSGHAFLIREALEEDAAQIIAHSRLMFSSTDQLLNTVEEYTIGVDDEKTWISRLNQNPDALLLVAFQGKELVGFLFFLPNTKKKIAHTGEFGVNVHPSHQGEGIGKAMVETLLVWANNNIHIEKVYLTVFATNSQAIALYKALGFREEGRLVKGAKQLSGEYVDILQMYLETKEKA